MRSGPGLLVLVLALGATLQPRAATAHHSYAMFDMSTPKVVQGSVANVEWANPHVFVWLYVRKAGNAKGYDLYSFENGPISILADNGWKKDSFKSGDRISVQFFPLRDTSKSGGYFIRALRPDGTEQIGDPHAPGVARELAKKFPVDTPKP